MTTNIIFDTVIKSKLIYGKETLQLTDTLIKKLDAFQMKGLRINTSGKAHTLGQDGNR